MMVTMPSLLRRPFAAALLLAAAISVGGCDLVNDAPADQVLTIYVSGPFKGPSGSAGRDIADGARLALKDAGGEAAGRQVRAVYLDGSEGSRGWTQDQAARNARTATEDSTTIAYIGDFESGATRVSLPITNEAGILQVSAGSTAVDLVRPDPGSAELPSELQASGDRTFARVIPDDDAQASAAPLWAKRLGARSVIATSDGTPFGDLLASGFELAADQQGLRLTDSLFDADLVFYAGSPGAATSEIPPRARRRPDQLLLASDAFLPFPPGSGDIGGIADGFGGVPLRTTASAQAPSQLPAAAESFLRDFNKAYGRKAGSYAAYGYEAMAAVLDSLERAEDASSRASVRDAFFGTKFRKSILGEYSIDEVGNTTLSRIAGYELTGADGEEARPVILLPQR